MCSDIAIRVSDVSKHYQIYDKPIDRLKQSLFRGRRQYYKEFKALDHVSFEVKKGETVGIIGRNGSGKSTLLQMICGTLNPTSGSIEVNGRVAALLELGAGFNPEFTGRENIYMNASIQGLTNDEIDARYDPIVDFSGIGEFIDQPVKTYSSGMYVRLAFSVAINVDPDILIIDEALSVGDERFQRKCFARLEELKQAGTSILFVSHATTQVIELCEKVLLLESGERILYESPVQVVKAYQRLIYATDADAKKILNEYRVIDDGKKTISYKGGRDVFRSKDVKFDKTLTSKSKVIYPVQGARIENISIYDKYSVVVNVLSQGECFEFIVSGDMLSDVRDVYFGLHIKTISGVEVSGQRYPEEGEYISNVKSGSGFKVIFKFKMMLMPGVYFVGCGVWSKNEPGCLHRIIDAIMVRVVSDEKKISFGYVDLKASEPRVELS